MYNSLPVVAIDGSREIRFLHDELQLLIVHWLLINKVSLQFNCISEIIVKSWIRRNCNGDDIDDELGMSVTVGGKHPKAKKASLLLCVEQWNASMKNSIMNEREMINTLNSIVVYLLLPSWLSLCSSLLWLNESSDKNCVFHMNNCSFTTNVSCNKLLNSAIILIGNIDISITIECHVLWSR